MNAHGIDKRLTLLLVDDEPVNLQVLKHILQDQYRLIFARDGEKAIQLAQQEHPALMLLDVMMPGLTGFSVCKALKDNEATAGIPIIFVTALGDVEDETRGFELGAVDYISKPVNPAIVKARVRTHLSLVNTTVLRQTRLQVIQRLGRAAEYKDNETGLHVIRMSHYSRVLSLAAGFDENEAEELLCAAPMHDIGKIGIPDAILQKKGGLDESEWVIMRKHPQIGAELLGGDNSSLLQMAARVALSHHEKWNGCGYPKGLKEEAIPIEARIVAVADVFDALTSVRPYKPAWPVEQAIDLIQKEKGRHFDPTLAELFMRCMPDVLEIKEKWKEE